MNAPQFLEAARELDAALQHVDRQLLVAATCHCDPRFTARLIETRNELTRQWGDAWRTQKVQP